MQRIIRSNAVETSSQGDSSAMNLYNLYPYYKLALTKTSLLGELSAKITKTLVNSVQVKLKQTVEKFQSVSLPLKAAKTNQSLGKLCTHLLIDGFLAFVNIQHRQIADNFPKAI
ncbi:hypothetical protein Npun_R1543 [Nostoc punctiforme PCC 73102]|uniref:Uncharacterized protein n=2 Tax=Nostoc punctiforme TaxID=272131 RepID=B2J0L5_NOSP7|nr:hypothetical protein Npun_R1543 [Nostoc punctiforme PCC 73102]